MCHKGDEGRLAQQCRFTTHIGTGKDDDLLGFAVQEYIIGNVQFSRWQVLLDYGVTTVFDVEDGLFTHFGLCIVVLNGYLGQALQAIDLCHDLGIELHGAQGQLQFIQ